MEKIKKKHDPIAIITAVFVIITIVMVILLYNFYAKGFTTVDKGRNYGSYYVMIGEDTNSSLWQAIYDGASAAATEQDIFVDMLGDNLPAYYTKTDLLKIAIASKADGIIIDADESEEMTELINEAVASGIPVVTLIDDNTVCNRCSFIGIGRYNIGREYGHQIIQIIKDKRQEFFMNDEEDADAISNIGVTVLLESADQDAGQIISGIRETLAQENNTGTEVSIEPVLVDNSSAFSVEESVRDMFIQEDIPQIIICLDELTTTCVYQAVVDRNMVGKTNILGYYNSDTIVNAISRGAIYSSISVDTTQLGEYCVEALKDYNELGTTSQYFTADLILIDKINAASFMKKEEQ